MTLTTLLQNNLSVPVTIGASAATANATGGLTTIEALFLDAYALASAGVGSDSLNVTIVSSPAGPSGGVAAEDIIFVKGHVRVHVDGGIYV